MPLAALVARLVGLWILTGAVLKALYGSPADLPQVVQDLPLSLTATFKLTIAVELVVGFLVLLRPSRGWVPALLLLLAFASVLVIQVVAGEASCGCFGAALVIAPGVILALDGALALLLVLSRPWRLEPGRGELPWPAVAVVALGSVALPLLLDRAARPGDQGGGGGFQRYVDLELDRMQGRKLAETPLHGWLSEDQRITDGLLVIWRASCPVCADHLARLADDEDGERDVVLLELPMEHADEQRVVERMPLGAWVQEGRLPEKLMWSVTPPVHIEVLEGVVTLVLEGMDVLRRKR